MARSPVQSLCERTGNRDGACGRRTDETTRSAIFTAVVCAGGALMRSGVVRTSGTEVPPGGRAGFILRRASARLCGNANRCSEVLIVCCVAVCLPAAELQVQPEYLRTTPD